MASADLSCLQSVFPHIAISPANGAVATQRQGNNRLDTHQDKEGKSERRGGRAPAPARHPPTQAQPVCAATELDASVTAKVQGRSSQSTISSSDFCPDCM